MGLLMSFDPAARLPARHARARSGLDPAGTPLADVTLDAAARRASRRGRPARDAADARRQAEVARAAGAQPLAAEPRARGGARRRPGRALLEVYTALRPRRSTRRGARGLGGASTATARRRRRRSSARRRPRTASVACSRERSGRFALSCRRELRRELLVSPLPELGLVAADGPNDPEPELVVEAAGRASGRSAPRPSST